MKEKLSESQTSQKQAPSIKKIINKQTQNDQLKQQQQQQQQFKQNINDIFKNLKDQPQKKDDQINKQDNIGLEKKLRKKNMNKLKKISENNSNKQKTTEEGFRIYNEQELQLGKGGDTDLCPFDCECCF